MNFAANILVNWLEKTSPLRPLMSTIRKTMQIPIVKLTIELRDKATQQ